MFEAGWRCYSALNRPMMLKNILREIYFHVTTRNSTFHRQEPPNHLRKDFLSKTESYNQVICRLHSRIWGTRCIQKISGSVLLSISAKFFEVSTLTFIDNMGPNNLRRPKNPRLSSGKRRYEFSLLGPPVPGGDSRLNAKTVQTDHHLKGEWGESDSTGTRQIE